ncbi:MAG: DSD1 family PLP-dependent enzyme [Betaproteobacteria bacterium]|nr:DSD1 family PLP-dependent enzyme [Betaproteobacteria bacterium]
MQPTSVIGLSLKELDTPSLIVDRPALLRNLARLMDSVKGTRVRVRAHAKSHKCPALAQLQIQHGAVGICCQKVSEAQVFAQAGIQNILVSNEVVGAAKISRLLALAQQADLTVCVDHVDNALALSQAFVRAGVRNNKTASASRQGHGGVVTPLKVLVEIDVGQGRCGVPPGAPAVALIQAITQMPGLSFQGLQAYHGTAQHLRLPSERRAAIDKACAQVRDTITRLQALGIACPIVAGAGTGSYLLEAGSGIYNEIQPGSYVFMDADYQRNQAKDNQAQDNQAQEHPVENFRGQHAGPTSAEFEQSLFVWAGVMSRPTPERAVVDAGLKAFSVDSGLPQVYGLPGVEYIKASDEHGVLRITTEGTVLNGIPSGQTIIGQQTSGTPIGSQSPYGTNLKLGDKLRIVPGHCDPTVNLYDQLFVVEDDMVVDVWPIAARGALY